MWCIRDDDVDDDDDHTVSDRTVKNVASLPLWNITRAPLREEPSEVGKLEIFAWLLDNERNWSEYGLYS